MEWNQLEYFKTVAELQHFTQAAKKLAISQSALSRSIAKLEEELGFPLFERYGKKILLNSHGQIFLGHVERALLEISKGRQSILDLINPEYGSVSLAFLHSLGSNIVPNLLGKFRQKYPKIEFKLSQNGTSFLLKQLIMGEIDLCLCSPMANQTSIEWTNLFTEELFVCVPLNHRLAGRSQITLHEIATEPLITFKKDYGLRILTDRLFHAAAIQPLVTFEGEEIMTVAGLVDAQLGVALIPHIAGLNNENIVFLPVSTPKCSRTIGIAWNKDRYLSPVAKRFKDFVVASFLQKGKELSTERR
ncbi:HTH-type transcriptional regulator GltC [bioreactor metagenome]|uniref:HTH-type transcriptional regulator GltC n=1 Tax=bioreactor metagenome TaxID=1076179 RepID=A0A644SUR9_9ZZZZ|nr:LysR family transcriptional regulator [Negativicutes bacterium]